MKDSSRLNFSLFRSEEPWLLVVGSDDDLCHRMSAMYHVNCASNEDEAVSLVKEPWPRAVLVSQDIGERSSRWICQHIKDRQSCSHIPVIFTVDEMSPEIELKALKDGFHEVLSRTASEELITLRIDSVVNRLKKSYHRSRFLDRVDQVLFESIEFSKFNVEELASRLHMDRKTLYNRIKKESGHTPQIYIRNTRICRAAHLLKRGTLSVSEVAFQTGFPDVSYFSRCFKSYFRKSPSEFQRKYVKEK